MNDFIKPAMDVNPYGLAVYGFLVLTLVMAVVVLWKSNQEKDKKIAAFFDRMIDVVEVNTVAIHELKEVINYLRNQK